MPLSSIQSRVLELICVNRSPESHLAGASGIHMSPEALRISHDLDLFHDHEQAVAEAFEKDRKLLISNGFTVEIMLSQPGFIRARILSNGDALLIDWAQDSMWRFMEPVSLKGIGYVLHPIDLAVNKVHALAGRDEPRDFLDTLYLHEKVLPLGTLIWAATGKDPGMNPRMLLELLQRKGRVTQEELDRLDLQKELKLQALHRTWKRALEDAETWIATRPMLEAGCLYTDPSSGRLIEPKPEEVVEILRGKPGGVLPNIKGIPAKSFVESEELRSSIESFFHRKLNE